MEQKSTFSLAIKPGLIIAAVAIAFNLLIWAVVADIEMQAYFGWFSYLIMGGGFFFFTVNYRDNVKEGYITYGDSFVFILFMSIVIGVVWFVYYYIFLSFIDPSYIQQLLELVENKYYEMGMQESQIEQSMKIVGYIYTPFVLSLFTLFGNILMAIATNIIEIPISSLLFKFVFKVYLSIIIATDGVIKVYKATFFEPHIFKKYKYNVNPTIEPIKTKCNQAIITILLNKYKPFIISFDSITKEHIININPPIIF